MKGRLYGVGVGPGDPELLTVKALRRIREADVIAIPGARKEDTTAYQIAIQAIPEVEEKPVLEIPWPMTKDAERLQQVYASGADRITEQLDAGRNVVFLTLGDPCIYSTYLYVHRLVSERGYETALVNGIPSFCAVAARLNVGLVEHQQALHVIPTLEHIEADRRLPGTKVFMKSGKMLAQQKTSFLESEERFYLVENCGMTTERILMDPTEIWEDAGYFTTILLKEK